MKNESTARAPESEASALRPPRSSRQRYLKFVEDYKQQRLDRDNDKEDKEGPLAEDAADNKPLKGLAALGLRRGKRREYLREYFAWLWPHRYAVGVLATLALMTAGLEMAEPLFMRFIVDRVLLSADLPSPTRL